MYHNVYLSRIHCRPHGDGRPVEVRMPRRCDVCVIVTGYERETHVRIGIIKYRERPLYTVVRVLVLGCFTRVVKLDGRNSYTISLVGNDPQYSLPGR